MTRTEAAHSTAHPSTAHSTRSGMNANCRHGEERWPRRRLPDIVVLGPCVRWVVIRRHIVFGRIRSA
jgi:hypothetical protein